MSAGRLFAIILIFLLAGGAWMALGSSIWMRTEKLDESLSAEVGSLWGPKVLAQPSPYWTPTVGASYDQSARPPESSTVSADIELDHRNKGLLWYSTFTVDFSGRYTVSAGAGEAAGAAEGFFVFPLPREVSAYHKFDLTVDGAEHLVSPSDVAAGRIVVPLKGPAEHQVAVAYTTGGQDMWAYLPGRRAEDQRAATKREDTTSDPGDGQLRELKNFSLTVTTDFADIDYPKGSRSPVKPAELAGTGMTARWDFQKALTSQAMGIVMARRVNAGPIAARMSFFAPVSLLFFFTVLFAVMVIKQVPLHPMHYLFISAGFFAFHILMAYLANVVDIHKAFWISAAVSVLLVVSYIRLVAGVRFALLYVGLAQLVYLIGFSYAFFWVGWTGLTVVIAAVVTLFVLMQATGRVDWQEVFDRKVEYTLPPLPPRPQAQPPPPPPVIPPPQAP